MLLLFEGAPQNIWLALRSTQTMQLDLINGKRATPDPKTGRLIIGNEIIRFFVCFDTGQASSASFLFFEK